MIKANLIFDNGGGLTMQLDGKYAHCYNDMSQAATDFKEYLQNDDTSYWEGHEKESLELDPDYDQIRNGGYKIYNISEILNESQNEDSTGWKNIDDFCQAIKDYKR